jgi:hypothetical protein
VQAQFKRIYLSRLLYSVAGGPETLEPMCGRADAGESVKLHSQRHRHITPLLIPLSNPKSK